MTLAATFAALMAVLALIAIPLPFTPVPVTLQVLGVYLAAALLGPVYGALACLIYLALGAAGLPVFAGATSGLPILMGPLGGYLLSYPVAAAMGGAIGRARSSSKHNDAIRLFVACAAALSVVYLVGVLWLAAFLELGIFRAALLGVVPFVPFDALKAVAAVPIAVRIRWAHLALPVGRRQRTPRLSRLARDKAQLYLGSAGKGMVCSLGRLP